MNEIKRTWEILSDKERQEAIEAIIAHFLDERDEKIGVVAAGNLLDALLQQIGPAIYNRALDDARTAMEQNLGNALIDVDVALRKQS